MPVEQLKFPRNARLMEWLCCKPWIKFFAAFALSFNPSSLLIAIVSRTVFSSIAFPSFISSVSVLLLGTKMPLSIISASLPSIPTRGSIQLDPMHKTVSAVSHSSTRHIVS